MNGLLLDIDRGFFDQVYFGEKVSNYLWFAGIALGTFFLKKPMAALLTRISSRLTARFSYLRHKRTIRTMLFKPMERLLQTILYFVAINQMDGLLDKVAVHHSIGAGGKINIRFGDVVDHVFYFFFIIYFTQVVTHFIDFIYYLRVGKAKLEKNLARLQLLPLLKEMAKLLSWTLSGFWILGSVFHVNIPALITGLGIGGVAIALAGKETVENFFAAFTILSDRPFQTGETIKLGDIEGVVERIGFRSTRLRNADGSEYIIPNQNLVSQSLINLSNRDNRGMKLVVNMKYGITQGALQQMITKLKDAIKVIHLVKEPVDVVIEAFDKETFQLVISYQLPHPLPDDATLLSLRRDVNMKVYEILSANAVMGTAIGTS